MARRYLFERFLILLLLALATAQFASAQQATSEDTEEAARGSAPRFGGPDSVGDVIAGDREPSDPAFRLPTLESARKDWFEWKDRIQEEHGLSFGFDYTGVILGASESIGDGRASGGILRSYGFWDLIGRGTANPGAFVWKVEHRHRYGNIPPNALASSIGYVGLFEAPFSNQGLRFTNLYWRQRFSGGRATITGGFLDTTDYVDTFALASPWTGFMNFAFSTGTTTIPIPDDATLGLAGATMLGKSFYVIAGLANANSDPTSPFSEVDSFFSDNEYFTSVEVGWTAEKSRIYFDNAHVTLWHADSRDEAGVPGGWGAAFSLVRYLDERWMPFVRGGFAKDGGTLMEASVSAGIGYDVVPKRGLLAFGFNWGQPNKDTFGPGVDDQYALELFYRFQVTEQFTVTPDIQFIGNPALNPTEDSIWVFGFRARLAI
jgi:porin